MSHGAVVAMVTGVKLALSASRGQEVLMTRSVRAQPLVCVFCCALGTGLSESRNVLC